MSNVDQTPNNKKPETKAGTSADNSKSTAVGGSTRKGSNTDNLISDSRSVTPAGQPRSNFLGKWRWALYSCIYVLILWLLSNINSASLLSHRVRFYSIAISTLLSLEPPYNWNKIVSNFVWELVKPPGSVLWLGNTINLPNSPSNEQGDGKIAPSWKLLVYFSMRLLIDAVRVSANIIGDCCQLLITGLNYWFVQKESKLEPSQIIVFYGQAFYLIALVWTTINIIQTVILIIKPSVSAHQHSRCCLRCIVRFINLTMTEVQLVKIVLRCYNMM